MCCKTIFTTRMSNIDLWTSTSAQHRFKNTDSVGFDSCAFAVQQRVLQHNRGQSGHGLMIAPRLLMTHRAGPPIWGIGRGSTLWQAERAGDRLWRGRSNVKRREFFRRRGGSLAARRACASLIGTRSADHIKASVMSTAQTGRTLLDPRMASTHGPSETSAAQCSHGGAIQLALVMRIAGARPEQNISGAASHQHEDR
jgi:hypothetical protein